MVVMDYVGDTHEELADVPEPKPTGAAKKKIIDEIREKVRSLHEAGFAHPDFRNVNVMVKKNGGDVILIIDFDWAGKINEARYPMDANINMRNANLPREGVDGPLITPGQDIYMADCIYMY